jgi:flagellar biosynthesis/type III secretory pathway chaperone
MDNLVKKLLKLLGELLACQERLLALALARREAMRAFEVDRLEMLTEQERLETQNLAGLDRRRKEIVAEFKQLLRGVEPTVTEISKRIGEPRKTQLLAMAGKIKTTVEQLDRNNRINATISESVVKGLAKVLKVVTGLAQHAGLYMRNGRKAALHGIHLLEITA